MNVWNNIRWGFSIFFTITGILYLFQGLFVAGLLITSTGVTMAPLLWKALLKGRTSYLPLATPALLLVIFAFLRPV